jgi:hypothetical protein
MTNPLEKIIKEYPERGPLSQYRFEKSISFKCFRCGETKISKLITIYNHDWQKKICNGCYGRLLSIYEIKNGQIEIDDKVEQLLSVLIHLVDINRIRGQSERLLLQKNKSQYLTSAALKFFATSECVAETLTKEFDLDWSPAVIGLCKVFELELIERFLDPIKAICGSIVFTEIDLQDKDYGRVVKYCAGRATRPPELGTIRHFILTVINSKDRIEHSDFLRLGFKNFINKRPNSDWIIDNNGLSNAIENLTLNYRNKAAHTDELEQADYLECKKLLFSDNGILWHLIQSTEIY